MQHGDTIAALSTPSGRGGLGVIRISGPDSTRLAQSFLSLKHTLRSWRVAIGALSGPDGAAVDQVLVTYFAAPQSYTGEDVVEISCHGSPVVLRYCLERAVAAGGRLAEPGEFTLRAYLNGRIDLPQAEAVRDLIEATTLYQARVAAQQIDGAVSRRLKPVKEQLLELIALLEAGIDFADNDVDIAADADLTVRIDRVVAGASKLIASFAYGKLVHEGLTLAIVGKPNAGKSSVFNRLLRQDRAIVTEIPGTTRDLVSETADIEGIPIRFVDTAGIRVSDDRVESMGIERSYQAMTDADVTLVIVDISMGLTAEDEALIQRAGRALVVANKSDLPHQAIPPHAIPVSALTGEGIPELRQMILKSIAPEAVPEAGFITSIRHEQLLRESVEALGAARAAVVLGIPHEMVLLDLYAALRPLDAITGATTADDILNRIFSTFCIGK